MSKISMDLIQQLRDITGVGMMDCKKALIETDGDLERAVVLLRKKGAAVAQKRADKEASQGLVESYLHNTGGSCCTLGVLVEVNCETDFVASTPDLKTFAKDLCMHIAALAPRCISPDQLDPSYLAKEKEIISEQLAQSGKPANMIEKIMGGKLEKLYQEVCLLKQPYFRDDKRTVEDILNDLVAKMGEKIVIKQFARFQVGAKN